MADSDGYIQEQCAEVCVGELLEDMVDTVQRTKKMYCNVWIKDWFTKDSSHPLTYVPLWAMSLPLKEGDKVMVAFTNGDANLPYLWKNPDEIDEEFYKKFEFPQGVQGGNATQPAAKDTVSAQKFGDGSYMVKTDEYTVFHQGADGLVLIDNGGKVYIQGKELNVVANGDCKIDVAGDCKVYSNKSVDITAKSGFTVNNHLKVTT